jgi:DNA-directed RNA polymerase subunit E'/Rpb7
METTRETTVEIVRIPAFLMDANIRENVLSILRMAQGTCRINGCITSIVSLDNINEAIIYPFDSDVHLTVRYTYESFKPSVGNVYNGMVYKSYDDGLLINIEGYTTLRVMTKQPTVKNKLIIGQYVRVEIEDIHFRNENKAFTILGRVIDYY